MSSPRSNRTGLACGAVAAMAWLVLSVAVVDSQAGPGRDHPTESSDRRPVIAEQDSIVFASKVMDNNLMHITVTNYGFAGNNFVSRTPSLEYPFGTGFEHMVRSGLWFGAEAFDDQGPFIAVVTGALDGAQGSQSVGATEYTPTPRSEFIVRSTLPSSPNFHPDAVSELDLIGFYNDHEVRRAANNIEDHRPVRISIRQENYSWSFADFKNFVVFKFIITNNGPPLRNVWAGFYVEFASGPKNEYSQWPPSSSGSALGGWYDKKLIGYDADIRLMREHYCAGNPPTPEICDFGLVPHWIGNKLLGYRSSAADVANKNVTFAAWNYSPGDTLRDTDVERYAIMSAGTIQAIDPSLGPVVGDPVQLLAIGPFSQIDPGDSISVDFAFVGGADGTIIDPIRQHSSFAQRAFDRDYIVPVPPPSPRLKVIARDETVDLYWDESPEFAEDPTSVLLRDFEGYRLYIGQDQFNMSRLAEYDKAVPPHDTTGFNTGFADVRLDPPIVLDGVTYHYKYTVPSLRNGLKYFTAVTAFDLGTDEIESLESGQTQNLTTVVPNPGVGETARGSEVVVFPNPYRVEAEWDQGRLIRDHYLWFANLPERCTIKIFTLAGDLVFETNFDGATYDGGNARGVFDTSREDPPTLSGRSFAWNLITTEGQAVATGLYMYSVRDRDSSESSIGKFLIVKSDREDF